MEAGERDELEPVAHRRQLLLEPRDRGVVEVPLPVERGRAVVREQLVGEDGVHPVGERARLLEVGRPGLAPEHVAVRRVRDGARDGRLHPLPHPVEALVRAGAGREALVARVHVARQQRRGQRVRPREQHGRDVEHVGGQAGGRERADEGVGRHEDLAAEVPALLLARELVLVVHAGGAGLDHGLHELERVQGAAEAGLGVGDDRRHELGLAALGPRDLIGALQGVVDAANDGRHRVRRVQGLVGVGLAGQVRVGRHLPPREVDRVQARLHHLDGLAAGEGAERGGVVVAAEQVPQPLGAVARDAVLGTERTPEPYDLLGRVGAFDAAPTRVGLPPPLEVVRLAADPLLRGLGHLVGSWLVCAAGPGNGKTPRRGERSSARSGCPRRRAPVTPRRRIRRTAPRTPPG